MIQSCFFPQVCKLWFWLLFSRLKMWVMNTEIDKLWTLRVVRTKYGDEKQKHPNFEIIIKQILASFFHQPPARRSCLPTGWYSQYYPPWDCYRRWWAGAQRQVPSEPLEPSDWWRFRVMTPNHLGQLEEYPTCRLESKRPYDWHVIAWKVRNYALKPKKMKSIE